MSKQEKEADPVAAGLSERRQSNHRLAVARALCVLLAVGAMLLYAAALPAYFARFREFEHIGSAEFQEMARRNLAALGISPEAYAGYYVLLSVLFVAGCLALALLIIARRGDEPMALFTATLLILLGPSFTYPAGAWESTMPALQRLQGVIGALSVSAIIIFFFVFPDGRFVPRLMKWLLPATAGYLALAALLGPESGLDPSGWPAAAYALFLAFWIVLGAAAQIYRYRRLSNKIERRQTRMVVFGFVAALLVSTGVVVVQGLAPNVEPGTVAELAASTIALAGMALIPLSIAGAILRYNLFAIDIIIRLTLIYSVLTAVLAGLFYLAVVLAQWLFVSILDAETPVELVTVITTLAIAALFTPVRRRVQRLIDRRFYRPQYDAQQTLARFARTARDEVDLDELAERLMETIEETMQPAGVSLWLRR